MALQLTVDYAVPELVERGFWRRVDTRELADTGNPSDENSTKDVWRDEPTHTIMLRPLQMNPEFLNTEQQLDSIIRLADFNVSATDVANTSIFEQPAFGNTNNPYIYHVPVGPSSAFPAAVNPMPGAPPVFAGVTTPYDTTLVSQTSQYRDLLYSIPAITPDPPYAAPTLIGSHTDAKFIYESKDRLAANQGLFIRWHQPTAQLGYPATYDLLVGQFCLRFKEVMCEVFLDTSAGGDRTSWRRIARYPLWSVGDVPEGVQRLTSMATPNEELAHDRYLLWLPYRRHQVLLQSNLGKWGLLTVRSVAKRLADGSDWDITRSDTLALKVLTPATGRIQIQKLKYASGARKMQSPTVTLDYTPAVAPTITLTKDSDHGSTITSTRTQPPSYTLPVNVSDECPPPTTDPATDQSRTYGVELTLTASSDQRWTPFFYGFELTAARTFATRPTTPFVIGDLTTATPYLQEATISAGLKPGEGRLSSARIVDKSPFNFTPYYYRSYYPLQIASNGVNVFTGISEPNEITPWKDGSARQITLSAVDRWKQLTDTTLLDQRDWSTYGHIDVVLFVMQQAGIVTTSAVVPAGYTTGVLNSINTPLGLAEPNVSVQTGEVKAPWKPANEDTAASYIIRIAEIFSGWDVGFYPDGTPFYLPRDYYTTPTTTFFSTTAGGSPRFRNATFRTIEPEANVVWVQTGKAADGGVQMSALWVDWASIKNPNAVNYIGHWRTLPEPIEVVGGWTCSQLNFMARAVFMQARRRHLTVEFEADFVPTLKVGHVCTLGSYGNYRIQDYQVDFVKNAWRPATYTAELLEPGFGV
jgi:hypothetical protein